MAELPRYNDGEFEKRSAAFTSVMAAIGLVSIKFIVGMLTGSLGILAEAAHSGLDLVAALLTFFAVKISHKPADQQHPYGHGKVESLSAMFETLLLIVTCIWIVYEAVHRLIKQTSHVDVTFWSFAVMAISIIVDFSRSKVLYRVARKFKSQALEADALHFSTDIWSSAVVILGLACVMISKKVPSLEWLHEADAVAALIVAMIVVHVSVRLGKRTVNALIDTAPQGLEEEITAIVKSMPGVRGAHNVRARYYANRLFLDIHVLLDGDQSLTEAHRRTEEIEEAIQRIHQDADVTVHPEPDRRKSIRPS